MGEIVGLKKASLQVKSTDAAARTSSKSFDILNEKAVFNYDEGETISGDALSVRDLARAIYAKSMRSIAEIRVNASSLDYDFAD